MIEYITNIPVEKLKPFPNHPFQVRDDDSMRETVESIKTYGVLQPAIVRPSDDGNYEILSGHRRKHACELAGRKTIPAIVRELDDDAAIIFMVDSNLQRENILPSERAAAVNTVPDAPTARHTAPHKNGGEPHQKSDTDPPKSTHSSCPSSRKPPLKIPMTVNHLHGSVFRLRVYEKATP